MILTVRVHDFRARHGWLLSFGEWASIRQLGRFHHLQQQRQPFPGYRYECTPIERAQSKVRELPQSSNAVHPPSIDCLRGQAKNLSQTRVLVQGSSWEKWLSMLQRLRIAQLTLTRIITHSSAHRKGMNSTANAPTIGFFRNTV